MQMYHLHFVSETSSMIKWPHNTCMYHISQHNWITDMVWKSWRKLGTPQTMVSSFTKLEYVYQMMIHAIYTFIYITHGIILKILLPNLWVFCLHLGLPLFLWTKYTICLKQWRTGCKCKGVHVFKNSK